MLLAVLPLFAMPAVQDAPSAVPYAPWGTFLRALVDRQYWRLLLFSCCFSIVNGITAAAQEAYPVRVLEIKYVARQLLQGFMRSGQFVIAPWVGRLVDRYGNRPVLVVSQLITATGPLFFLAATPERPWFVAGAFVVWIAYAGTNVGLDNIKLKLAPSHNNAPYLALYHALSDLANGVAIVGGGVLLDSLLDASAEAGSSGAIRLYGRLFLIAWIGRTLMAALLAGLIEPGARRVRELLTE
jgi:predicted MFS family arabinose efflux permease